MRTKYLLTTLVAFGTALGLATSAGAATPGTIVSEAPQPTKSAAAQVDALLAQEIFLNDSTAELAPVTGDEVFLRRVSLDLVGELPTPAEITVFVLDPATDKRARLVERLLADSRFGRNWARYWRDVILYRRVEDRALLVSQALESYLTDEFNKNTSWDKIAQAFVEATGDAIQTGQTAIILAQMADANDVAAETARIFLGIQIQCAQCHDHPTDRWKREQFHEFAAFFPRASVRPTFKNGQVRGVEVVSFDVEPRYRRPNMMFGRGALEHYMPDLKDPSSKGKLMTPAFFATGRKLKTGVPDKQRRTTLADWMTAREDGWFAKAFVNRIWAELVGEGFYEPVDDMGPDRACTAPQTMQYLAGEFAARQYDVKWLYRTILATTTYQRESRPKHNMDEPAFTANCAQRLRGDQIFNVLSAALGLDLQSIEGRGPQYLGMRFGPRFQFNSVFGYDPSDRRDEVTGSIPQALALMNGQFVNRTLVGKTSGTPLGKLLANTKDNEAVTVELYLRCLAREPNNDELKTCLEHVRTVGSRSEAFEDILWALVNRTEFLHRN
jgi:uncharacterized protein DUF1549/uncharacterized protein DUF1553